MPAYTAMSKGSPDFYLGSSEHRGDWAKVRASRVIGCVRMPDGTEGVLVEVDPPVIGQPFGLGDKDISILLLAPRHKGAMLDRTAVQPQAVLIYRLLTPEVAQRDVVRDSEVKLSAWGEVYSTREGADSAARRGGR